MFNILNHLCCTIMPIDMFVTIIKSNIISRTCIRDCTLNAHNEDWDCDRCQSETFVARS